MNRSFLFIILSFISWSCANQKPPTGGPQDEDPPKLLSSIPLNQQLNFDGQTLVLEFDEYIKLDKPNEQILITPRLPFDYEVTGRKRTVTIEFEEPLPDSTTYTINFREAVVDLNESNPAENLKIAFSTGDYLDSIRFSGFIQHLTSKKRLKNMSLGLFPINDTLNVYTDEPYYFTKADDEGAFLFENIQNGEYLLYAFRDKNKNLIINSNSEIHGFFPDTLKLQNSIPDSLIINAYHLNTDTLKLQSHRQNGTVYQLRYNKYITSYELHADSTIDLVSNFKDPEHETIQIFHTFDRDSIYLTSYVTDSLGLESYDSLYVKLETTIRSPEAVTNRAELQPVYVEQPEVFYDISFSKPITTVNYDSLYIFLDSANILTLDSSHLFWNSLYDQVTVNYKLDPAIFEKEPDQPDSLISESNEEAAQQKQQNSIKPYIKAGKTSFITIEKDTLPPIRNDLVFKDKESFGIILVNVQCPNQNFMVELVDRDNVIIQERRNVQSFSFINVNPGTYRLRLKIDENKNGRYDLPEPFQFKPAEPIYYYKNSQDEEDIIVRANWEIGPAQLYCPVD